MTRRRGVDRAFTAGVVAMALFAFSALVITVGEVVRRGAGAVDWAFLTQQARGAGSEGGIVFQILGTTILIAAAALVAAPIAAGTGLWLEVWAGSRTTRIMESALHALNAVPSIVFGLAGYSILSVHFELRKSWLAGGVVLGVMILPTVTVAFVDKLRSVPRPTVEAAHGLGLSRSQVALAVYGRQAFSGLLTGLLLGLARAAGETAPIMFTAVIFSGATVPTAIADSPVLALPYHIFVLVQDSFDAAALENAWGAALVLLLIVLVMALVALPFRLRAHEEARRV